MNLNSGLQSHAQPVSQAGGATPLQEAQQQQAPAQPQLDLQQLLEEKRKFDEFKNQLISVYNELKVKDELVSALKTVGVDNAEDFKTYQQKMNAEVNKQQNPQKTQAEELYPKEKQEGGVEFQSDNEKKLQQRLDRLEKVTMEQQHVIERNTLREQVRGMINENDFPMLSRGLDDGLLDNIIYNRLQFQNQNKKELPLEDALKYSEQNLQAVFKRLGGEVGEKPAINLGQAAPKVGPGVPEVSKLEQSAQSVLGNQAQTQTQPQVSQPPPYSGSGQLPQSTTQQKPNTVSYTHLTLPTTPYV